MSNIFGECSPLISINLTNVNSSIFSINQSMDIKEKEKEKAPQKKKFSRKISSKK